MHAHTHACTHASILTVSQEHVCHWCRTVQFVTVVADQLILYCLVTCKRQFALKKCQINSNEMYDNST